MREPDVPLGSGRGRTTVSAQHHVRRQQRCENSGKFSRVASSEDEVVAGPGAVTRDQDQHVVVTGAARRGPAPTPTFFLPFKIFKAASPPFVNEGT